MSQLPDEPYHINSSGSQAKEPLLSSTAKKPSMNWKLVLAIFVVVFGSSFQFGFGTSFVNNTRPYIEETFNTKDIDSCPGYPYNSTLCQPEFTSGKCEWNSKTNPPICKNKHFDKNFGITVSMYGIGGLIGSFGMFPITDKIGRKWAMFLATSTVYLSSALQIFVTQWWMFMLGRLTIGIAAGAATTLVPMFIAEISPIHIRGALSTVHQLFITIGIFIVLAVSTDSFHLLASEQYWPYILVIPVVAAGIQWLVLPFLSDSVVWLYKNKGPEAAKAALKFYRSDDADIDSELDEVAREVDLANKSSDQAMTFMMLLKDTKLRKPLIIGSVLQLTMQLSGIDAVLYYSTYVFMQTGMEINLAQVASTLVGLVNVLVTIVAVFIMDKAGRRTLQLWGLGGMGLSYIAITLCFQLANHFPSSAHFFHWASVFSMVSIIIFFAFGPGCIAWFMIAELFPVNARAVAQSFGMALNWITNWLVAFTFPMLAEAMGPEWVFVIFVCTDLFFWCFTYYFVPETQGATIEQTMAKLGIEY